MRNNRNARTCGYLAAARGLYLHTRYGVWPTAYRPSLRLGYTYWHAAQR